MQLRKEVVIPVIVGVSSLIVGTGVGYVIARIRTQRPFFEGTTSRVGDDRVETEVELAGKGDIEGAGGEIEETQPELPFGYEASESRIVIESTPFEFPVEEPETRTLMDDVPLPKRRGNYLDSVERGVENDYWDYNEEAHNRGPDRPYIIHVDEYQNNEMDFPRETLTYYAGDDVLCDNRDQPIYNRDKIVGLLLFGHGSEDPNIVFVRNEKIECEYEILRKEGHFGVEVQGMDEEIQHTKKRKGKIQPKFRLE